MPERLPSMPYQGAQWSVTNGSQCRGEDIIGLGGGGGGGGAKV